MERLETYLQMHADSFSNVLYLEYFVGSCYYIFHLLSAACLLMYLMAILNINIISTKNLITIFAAFAIGTMLVILNFFTPILFYYSEDGSYHRASFQFLYYVLAAYYFIYSIYFIYNYRKVIHKRNLNYISIYIFSIIIGIAIQFLFPHMLIEEFFNAVSIVFAYIVLESPSEVIDIETDFYNKRTFVRDLQLSMSRKFKNPIVFVSVDIFRNYGVHSSQISSDELTKRISNYLKKFSNKSRIYRFDDTTYALMLRSEDKTRRKALMETIAERLGKPWNVNGIAIDAQGFVWSMDYVYDYDNVSDLISKVRAIIDLYKNKGQSIVAVEDIKFEKEFIHREFDKHVRNCLEKNIVNSIYQFGSGEAGEKFLDCMALIPDKDGKFENGAEFITDKIDTKALSDTDVFMIKEATLLLENMDKNKIEDVYVMTRISRTSLTRKGVVNNILSIIGHRNFRRDRMIMRISETAFSTLGDYGWNCMKEIRQGGFTLVIDRFGIGYSNMEKLVKFNVFGVIIDHEIIAAALKEEIYKGVVKDMISMLHDMSMYVFAEMINTKEEADIAEFTGCDYMFGRYYGSYFSQREVIENILAKKD